MKKYSFVVLISVMIIILTNTPPAQYFLLEKYHYQNADNSFSYSEFKSKGLDFEVCEIRWKRFLDTNPKNKNQTLYRTFTIRPWQFWEWWQYLAHPKRFTLPYLPDR